MRLFIFLSRNTKFHFFRRIIYSEATIQYLCWFQSWRILSFFIFSSKMKYFSNKLRFSIFVDSDLKVEKMQFHIKFFSQKCKYDISSYTEKKIFFFIECIQFRYILMNVYLHVHQVVRHCPSRTEQFYTCLAYPRSSYLLFTFFFQ